MGGKQEKESNVIAQEYGKKRGSYIFFFTHLIVSRGFGHTWEPPTLMLIKRHHHSPAFSRMTAGNNTKQSAFSNCLHTCKAVELTQLAMHCLLCMKKKKQLK